MKIAKSPDHEIAKIVFAAGVSYSCPTDAPVAQLDRAIASGAIGREFESLRARHSSFLALSKIMSNGFL
jgi:hypothetical protein